MFPISAPGLAEIWLISSLLSATRATWLLAAGGSFLTSFPRSPLPIPIWFMPPGSKCRKWVSRECSRQRRCVSYINNRHHQHNYRWLCFPKWDEPTGRLTWWTFEDCDIDHLAHLWISPVNCGGWGLNVRIGCKLLGTTTEKSSDLLSKNSLDLNNHSHFGWMREELNCWKEAKMCLIYI